MKLKSLLLRKISFAIFSELICDIVAEDAFAERLIEGFWKKILFERLISVIKMECFQ